MSIPETVKNYMVAAEVNYRVLRHGATSTSQETAHAARVPGDRMAKAVVLDDGESLLVAVIPATHRIDPAALGELIERRVHLVDESDFETLFRDCRPGAVPPLGQAYGLPTVVADALIKEDEVFFEAGDHETVVQVSRLDFQKLMAGVPRGAFSHHM